VDKYDPLYEFLSSTDDGPLQMSFSEIERLGISLPMSAFTYDAWWLDRSKATTHVHARAWLDNGRQVIRVDRNQQRVWFSGRRRTTK